MYILIVGGGKVGSNLTSTLMKMGHEVTLVEGDRGVRRVSDQSGAA